MGAADHEGTIWTVGRRLMSLSAAQAPRAPEERHDRPDRLEAEQVRDQGHRTLWALEVVWIGFEHSDPLEGDR